MIGFRTLHALVGLGLLFAVIPPLAAQQPPATAPSVQQQAIPEDPPMASSPPVRPAAEPTAEAAAEPATAEAAEEPPSELPPDAESAPAEAAEPPLADVISDLSPDIDPAVIERVITLLENDVERQQLLDTLRAIVAVEATAPEPEPPGAQPIDWLRQEIERRVAAVETSLDAVLGSAESMSLFASWLSTQFTTPNRRAFWAETLGQIGLVLGLGLIVGLLIRRALAGVRARFVAYAPPTPLHFAVALVLHVTVRLVPIVGFIGVAALIALLLELGAYTTAVTRSLVEGLAFVTALTAVVRAVLNVDNPNMRLFAVEPDIGHVIQRRVIRVIAIAGYGYYGLEAARALGLPWTLYAFFEHIMLLLVLFLFIRLVISFRRLGAEGFEALARESRSSLVGRFLPWNWVARIWHVGAILLALVIFSTWSLDIAGGPAFLARAIGVTFAVLFLSRLINVWLTERALAASEPTRRPGDDDQELTDVIVKAASSPLSFALRVVTTVVAIGAILQAWGVDVWGWLGSEAGEAVRDAVFTAALTLGVAYMIWRLLNGVIRGAIEETDRLGRPVRSSRTQTLLTIGRNFLFVLIWLSAGILALSELGVNLAPLLAGAGVIGLAIGFGSQQLVQDIITGFFILVEDTMAVGDVADLGGKVGVVEAVTLRTVRLRGYDGQVHTIPYSTISTISNLTKDFSYYVFDIGVAYKEDVDHVMRIMAEVGEEMQHERAYRRLIVAPLEVAGVDAFADSAVMIKARLKTRPLQQWTVGREYNRRLKKRFDAEGIEIPFPQRTLHMSMPAPPAMAPTPPSRPVETVGAPDGPAINVPDTR